MGGGVGVLNAFSTHRYFQLMMMSFLGCKPMVNRGKSVRLRREETENTQKERGRLIKDSLPHHTPPST